MTANNKAFCLEDLEGLVYSGHHLPALAALIRFLHDFDSYHLPELPGEAADAYYQRERRWVTRIAAACTALFAHPGWQFSDTHFHGIARYHSHLWRLYRFSAFESSVHVATLISSARFSKPREQLKRLLLFTTLDSPQTAYQSLMIQRELALPVVLSMCSESGILDAQASANQSYLLDNLPELTENLRLDREQLRNISAPWMRCSYVLDERRHFVKAVVNHLITNSLTVPPIDRGRERSSDKPSLGVAIEICREGHAMYRCYGALLRGLREQFHVTFYGESAEVDNTVRGWADKFVAVDLQHQGFDKIAASVRNGGHDMLFFPSLGMKTWTVLLCNFRLAPVQAYCLGHPATSCSAAIDYAIAEPLSLGSPGRFTERLLAAPAGFTPMALVPPSYRRDALPSAADDALHIAVVSKHNKLNKLLLDICRAIDTDSARTLHFHFFPGAEGLFHSQLRADIQQSLPNATVYPYSDYATYMHNIARCALRIGTLPFGGSNTTFDCMALGIPSVVYEGEESFSRCEPGILRASGLLDDEALEAQIAHSADEMIAKVGRLIADRDFYARISAAVSAAGQQHRLFNEVPGLGARALRWLLQNHEELQQREHTVIAMGTDVSSQCVAS